MTTAANNNELLLQSFALTQELLSELINDCGTIPSLGTESIIYWNKNLARLSNDISQFVEITTLLARSVSKKGEATYLEIKNSHIQLLFVMKAIGQAQLKADIIALQDLIKHELKDNLTQWKIDLIPQLKKLLT